MLTLLLLLLLLLLITATAIYAVNLFLYKKYFEMKRKSSVTCLLQEMKDLTTHKCSVIVNVFSNFKTYHY
jgi:hypothetical protein